MELYWFVGGVLLVVLVAVIMRRKVHIKISKNGVSISIDAPLVYDRLHFPVWPLHYSYIFASRLIKGQFSL